MLRVRMLFIRLCGTLLAGCGFALMAHGAEPAFECRYAKLPTEVAICESDYLSRLDRVMARLYNLALESDRYGPAEVRALQRDHENWRESERNACGADKSCIASEYEYWIPVLKKWGLAAPAP